MRNPSEKKFGDVNHLAACKLNADVHTILCLISPNHPNSFLMDFHIKISLHFPVFILINILLLSVDISVKFLMLN